MRSLKITLMPGPSPSDPTGHGVQPEFGDSESSSVAPLQPELRFSDADTREASPQMPSSHPACPTNQCLRKTACSNSKIKHERITRWGLKLHETAAGQSPVSRYYGVTARNPNCLGKHEFPPHSVSRRAAKHTLFALRPQGLKRGSLDRPE